MEHISELIEFYGIYAVFALCTVEGDITLLLSGVMAHSGFFGKFGFLKIFLAGIAGGMVGDSIGYWIGRLFRTTVKNYRFYKMAQPRIEKIIDKFGGFAIIISKFIYGIRGAMCLFYGVARMPYWRFLILDLISCIIWVSMLSGIGYFFSGAITSIIGDFKQVGIALFFIVMFGVIVFYLVEHYWLSPAVEEADPKTINKIEEKFHNLEEAAQEKLHDLGEKLHLTSSPDKKDVEQKENAEIESENEESETIH